MPPAFALIFFVGPAVVLGLIAVLASVLLGLGKGRSVWVDVTRGALAMIGALVGYIGGGLAALILGPAVTPGAALSPAGVGFGILAGLVIGALVGGVLALRFVRLAYDFIGWLADKTGVADGAA